MADELVCGPSTAFGDPQSGVWFGGIDDGDWVPGCFAGAGVGSIAVGSGSDDGLDDSPVARSVSFSSSAMPLVSHLFVGGDDGLVLDSPPSVVSLFAIMLRFSSFMRVLTLVNNTLDVKMNHASIVLMVCAPVM